jgi:hypothetical protein
MRPSETEDAGRMGQAVSDVMNKRENNPEGLAALELGGGPFCTPRRPSERAGKGIRRERDGDPLRGGPKLGTCAADARKRIPGTGNKPTKSNRTVVVVWHGEPMRDPRSGARRKSHRLRVEGELKVSGG